MRSQFLIAVALVVGAGCPSRKPADTQPAPPARTELDRSPGFAVEAPKRPELVEGAYVWACPLTGLQEAEIAISRNKRLSLSNGSRLLSVLELDDDFFASETDVNCQKGFVSVRREKDGRYRETGFGWDGKRLVKTARAEGIIPPARGP